MKSGPKKTKFECGAECNSNLNLIILRLQKKLTMLIRLKLDWKNNTIILSFTRLPKIFSLPYSTTK